MKSLLLPLLAALALPTAINAENIYLKCTPNSEEAKIFSITIDEANSSATVSTPLKDGTEQLNKGTLFATRNAYIVKAGIVSGIYQKFDISRLNGSFTKVLGSSKFPDKIPESKVFDGSCVKEDGPKTLF